MKTLNLLPNKYKIWGWVIFIPALLTGIIVMSMDFDIDFTVRFPIIYNSELLVGKSGWFVVSQINVVNNLAGFFVIIGGLLIGFSKEKEEDEYVNHLRLNAILWSIKVSYLIFLILFIAVFGIDFIKVMVLVMYLPLILYIFRFHYLLVKTNS